MENETNKPTKQRKPRATSKFVVYQAGLMPEKESSSIKAARKAAGELADGRYVIACIRETLEVKTETAKTISKVK